MYRRGLTCDIASDRADNEAEDAGQSVLGPFAIPIVPCWRRHQRSRPPLLTSLHAPTSQGNNQENEQNHYQDTTTDVHLVLSFRSGLWRIVANNRSLANTQSRFD